MPKDQRARFEGEPSSLLRGPKPMLIADYSYPQLSAMLRSKTLLHEGFYYDAARELSRVFQSAESERNLLLQADSAGRAALVHLEIGNFKESATWARRSCASCSESVGVSLGEIVHTASPISTPPSGDALAARILSDTLHNYCQVLVRQMVYYGKMQLEQSAREALRRCLELDHRLGLVQPAGNDIRCLAVVDVAGKSPNLKSAMRLIDECKQNFARGGLFEAHLVKTRAIVRILSGDTARGRDRLVEAEEMLRLFPDGRGLAMTMYLLSDAILRTSSNKSGKRREALRQIIAAAALHPYNLVVDRCREQAQYANRREVQREIDDLVGGKGDYAAVHRMLSWLAEGSSYTSADLLFRNIDLLIARGFPHVELPTGLTSKISADASHTPA
jgi:tetratricopeptide (TPR) repeat protein